MNAKKRRRVDRRQARAWMVMQDIRPQDIQKAIGLRYHTQVVETLGGYRNDRRVLAWLKNAGCPEEFLKLPSSMQENEQ